MTTAQERHKQIADDNTILRAIIGSALYGTGVEGTSDRDEQGICIEPPCCVIGLENFEQYEFHTANEGDRSGTGDLDLTVYSLRKWAKLAAGGNPNVLPLLFTPEPLFVDELNFGTHLQRQAPLFATRQAAAKFSGYLLSQSLKMQGLRGNMTNRPELIEAYGFDSKFAYHAVRLGLQGVEFLKTGRITLPVPEPDRQWLKDLRVGKHTMQEALDRIDALDAELGRLAVDSDLPAEADWVAINAFLTRMYTEWWDFRGYC